MSHGGGFEPRRFVLGQFDDSEVMLAATKKLREKGHKKLDTHTPYPVPGIEEALGLGRPKIPTIVLIGALTGTCLAFAMIYFCNVIDFPINVANRPINSPAANVPIMFELTILLGSFSAFMGLMGLMRLPEPYHPVFEAESFRRASIDSFFVSVELVDAHQSAEVVADLRSFGSMDVQVVEESER
jgi:hypothetical protein